MEQGSSTARALALTQAGDAGSSPAPVSNLTARTETCEPAARPRSSTAGAVRKRAWRARRKAGRWCVSGVEIDDQVLDLLVAAGVLERWNDADAAAIRQAVSDYLWLVSRYETP